jgi:hypothetical protein
MTASKGTPPSSEGESQKGGIKRLRTYANDIARMFREKRLSQNDIAKLDPQLLEAIKRGEVPESPAEVLGPRVGYDVSSDLLAEELAAEAEGKVQSSKNIDQTFDLDAEEKKLGKSSMIGEVVAEPQKPEPVPEKLIEVVEPKPTSVPEPVKELTPAEKLKQEELKLQAELTAAEAQKKNLTDQEAALQQAKATAEAELAPTKVRETEIEKSEAELLEQEAKLQSLTEKRDVEKKRWSLEEERQRIEQERWAMDQKILGIEKQITELLAQEAEAEDKKHDIEGHIDTVKKMEAALVAKAEKIELSKKFEEIKTSRAALEKEWKELMDTKHKAEVIDAELLKREVALRSSIFNIESKEHQANSAEEVHDAETKRWEKEKDLRHLEEEVWKDEEDISKIQQLIDDVQKRSEDVLASEKSLNAKIAELDSIIKAAE